jgi:TonB-dependent starch-binding outer membrane protein SusC
MTTSRRRATFTRDLPLRWGVGLALCGGCAAARPVPNRPPPAGDDSVVVGYGTQRRRDVLTAVGSVAPRHDERVTARRVEELLEGRVGGVEVRRLPGGRFAVSVRGAGHEGREPLWVVDGVPLPAGLPSHELLAGISPADVARIDVLKDAGAAAAYGARGANGVILITLRGVRR